MVDAVILCGGLGRRLRDVTGPALPKVMVPLEGRPFLDLIIRHLKEQGLRRVILCTGYQAEVIEDYYQRHPQGLDIVFSREREPLGTGGALKNAGHMIERDVFFVMNGDSFCSLDFQAFLAFYQSKKTLAALAVAQLREQKDYGGVILDKAYRIVEFHEKKTEAIEGQSGGYVNAGIYCFHKNILTYMPQTKKFSMEYDVFPQLIREKIYGFPIKGPFFDIGTPQRLDKARREL